LLDHSIYKSGFFGLRGFEIDGPGFDL